MRTQSVNNSSDKQLVEQVLSGHAAAFKTIIKNTEGLVAQIIFRMVSNGRDRKDLAQDVYLKAFKDLRNFKFEAKLSTWIGQITYNTCLNYLQKKKLVLLDTLQTDIDEPEDAIIALGDRQVDVFQNDTHRYLWENELSNILTVEIDKLTPMYRTLITLYHHEQMSYDEIAEITQLPEGTLKNYLFRARKTLKENILLHYTREEL